MFTLNQIVALFEQHSQRATYGAVGGVVGRLPRSVMQGRPRNPRNSWVVRQADGLPTGYATGQVHPALLARTQVIVSPAGLAQWLLNPS